MPNLLTVEEVADALRIHPSTVRGFVKAGKLVGHDIGGYKITKESFDALLENTVVHPEPQPAK